MLFVRYFCIFRFLIGSVGICCFNYYKDEVFCKGKLIEE